MKYSEGWLAICEVKFLMKFSCFSEGSDLPLSHISVLFLFSLVFVCEQWTAEFSQTFLPLMDIPFTLY